MKKNYRAVLQYEGTRYQGWQRQVSTDNTIQGKLEKVLSSLEGKNVEVHSSGRTDAGVHAYGQVISFLLETEKTEKEIMEYMNRYLPQDMAVISLVSAGEHFHARLNAVGKVYRYRVLNSSVPHIFDRRYVYQMEEKLDREAMKKAICHLEGVHDFKAFTSKKNTKKSTVRRIYEISMEEKQEELVFTFHGDGFLYHMVRILMGTILEVGLHKREADSIPKILEAKDRSRAGFLAPAKGLALMKVYYD